jgi:hypothetical protein
MKRYLLWLVVGGLLVAVLAAACDDGDEGEPSPTASATGVASPTVTGPPFPFEGPVGIGLTSYGAFYDQGKPVQLTITVAASESVTLYYRTAQRYDIVITDQEGQEVWRWSKDKTFGEVLGEETLEENELLTFNESWDQLDNDGQPVPAANYTVTATSAHCDADLNNCGQLSASRTIQIRASQ